jgi:acyl-CoA thioester hydrolase
VPRSHQHRVQIRFGDLDILGHVNNACFLSYFEDARAAYLPAIGLDLAFPRVLARVEVDYLRSLLLSDREVEITTTMEKLGNRSFTLLQEMRTTTDVHARSRSVIVAFDLETQRSREPTAAERIALDAEFTGS